MEPSPQLWQPSRREKETESTPHLWKPAQKSTKQSSLSQPVRRSIPRLSSQSWHPFHRAMPIRLSPTRKPAHQKTPIPSKQIQGANNEITDQAEITAQDYNTIFESRPPNVSFQSPEEAKQYLQMWSLSEGFEMTKATTEDDRYYMICNRGYTMINNGQEIKRKRERKSSGCKFSISLQSLPEGWALSILDTRHNHPRIDPADLGLVRRMEMERVKAIIEAGSKLPPREDPELIHCKAEDAGVRSSILINDVNNDRLE